MAVCLDNHPRCTTDHIKKLTKYIERNMDPSATLTYSRVERARHLRTKKLKKQRDLAKRAEIAARSAWTTS